MPEIRTSTLAYAITALDREIKYYEHQLKTCDILPYETNIQDLLVQLDLAAQDLKQTYLKELKDHPTVNLPEYDKLINTNPYTASESLNFKTRTYCPGLVIRVYFKKQSKFFAYCQMGRFSCAVVKENHC